MDIGNATEALARALGQTTPELAEVESIHQAEIDPGHTQALLADPASALKAIGIPVSEASQIQITAKKRAHRDPRAAALRRVIVVIIHYRNCDTDVIIFL